jgi:hypothetical protein
VGRYHGFVDSKPPAAEIDARVLALRDSGTSWLDIQRELGLNRQQARYAYQRAKRERRRAERRAH